jgi:FG-GAP-like repeat
MFAAHRHRARRRRRCLAHALSATFLGIAVAVAATPVAAVHAGTGRSIPVNPSTHLPAGVTPVLQRGQPSIATGRKALRHAPVNAAGATQPHVNYYGGHMLSHVKVIQVLYGSGTYEPEVVRTTAPSTASFYQTATSSFYFDWLSEYNAGGQAIGRGSFQEQIIITPAPNNDQSTIDDTNIQAELIAQEAAHKLPAPDGNTLLAVYFPAGKTITDQGVASGTTFCGYHGTTTSGPEMFYSVLPDFSTGGMATNCGTGSEFQNVTVVSSHELVEATTDPEIGLAATLGPPVAWYDPTNGEVGDICLGYAGGIVFPDGRQYRVQAQWSNRQNACVFSGGRGVVAVDGTSAWAMDSTGFSQSFTTPTAWSSTTFFGSVSTLSGDVAGSGHDALVAVNGASIWVMTSDGSAFSQPVEWASTSVVGTRATFLADVNGDGRADLVAVNDHSTLVMLSTGSGFSAPVIWSSTPFYGSRATLAADVSGNGRADLVAVNDSSVFVMTSTGSLFAAPALWSSTAFFGSRATLAGDVSGDGIADLVAVNGSSTWVMTSTGRGFSAPAGWLGVPFYGSRATLLGDVTGDGTDALVAVNDNSAYAAVSSGVAFGQPSRWSSTPFYGSRTTLLGS